MNRGNKASQDVSVDQEGDDGLPALQKYSKRGAVMLFCLALVFRMLSRKDVPFFTGEMGFQWFVSCIMFTSLLFYLCGRFPGQTWRVPYNRAVILALLFFGWVGFSSLYGTYQYASWSAVEIWVGHLAAFLLVLLMLMNDRSLLVYPIATVCAAALVQMLIGGYQYLVLFPDLAQRVQENPSLLSDRLSGGVVRTLKRSIRERQPAGTLLNSNSYIALCSIGVLFLVGGLVFGSSPVEDNRDTNRYSTAKWILCTIFIGGLLVLAYLSGSKGGFVALVLALFGSGVLALKPEFGKKWWWMVGGLGIVVLLFVWIAVWKYDVTDRVTSLKYRKWYATAGVEIVRKHPITGVGLYNYQFYYPRYKPGCARETRRAHNDYLDVTAETGIPGGVLFLLFWLVLVQRLIPGPGGTGRETNDYVRLEEDTNLTLFSRGTLIYGMVAAAGMLMLMGMNVGPAYAEGDGFLMTVVISSMVFLFFAGAVLLFRPVLRRMPGTTGWKLLLSVPLLFYLIHATVDFDLYVPAVATPLWMLAALVSGGHPDDNRGVLCGKIGRNTGLLLSLILFLGLVPLLMNASSKMHSAVRLNGIPLKPRSSSRRVFETYQEILQQRPEDIRLLYRMSSFYHDAFCRRVPDAVKQKGNTEAVRSALDTFRTCMEPLFQSRRLMPANWSVHKQVFHRIRDHRYLFGKLPRSLRDDTEASKREVLSRQAQFEAIERAHRWYPDHPRVLFYYGRALKRRGQEEKGREMYRTALEIHRCQSLDRLRLTDDQLKAIRSGVKTKPAD